MHKFNYDIGRNVNYEELVARLYASEDHVNDFFAQLTQEQGLKEIKLQLQHSKNNESWKFILDDFHNCICEAILGLWEQRKPAEKDLLISDIFSAGSARPRCVSFEIPGEGSNKSADLFVEVAGTETRFAQLTQTGKPDEIQIELLLEADKPLEFYYADFAFCLEDACDKLREM